LSNHLKLKPFLKDISLTFITEAIVLVSFFFIYQLIAANWGPKGVGEYSLIKRATGFMQPLLLLGLWVGLPRYIAMAKDEKQRSNYIKAGGIIITITTFTFLVFVNLFKDHFAKIFFGTTNYSNLVLPFSLFLAGLNFHTLIHSYLRGQLLIKVFNVLEVVNLALIPIGILIFFKGISIEKLISLIGISTFMISLFFALFFIKDFFVPIKKWHFTDSLKELLYYSFPRFIASFVYAGLFSLGPIFAAHFASIQEVGYLSVGQSLLSAIAVAVAPLGFILLPKVSNMLTQKRDKDVKENLNYLIGATIQLSIFISFQLMIFADVIIKYWLGTGFIDAIPVIRIIFLSIIFNLFCGAVWSILEASQVKPINLINLSISLGVFLMISGILLFLVKAFSPIISLSIAFTSGLVCMGILTYISIRQIYPEKLNKDLNYLWIAIGINTLLGGVVLLTKSWIASRFYYLVIYEILISVIYLLILWLLKTDWLRKIFIIK
jgi:O-antigen/teichoic acid export membrane protein